MARTNTQARKATAQAEGFGCYWLNGQSFVIAGCYTFAGYGEAKARQYAQEAVEAFNERRPGGYELRAFVTGPYGGLYSA